jgi:hypothetical protein
MSGIAKNKGNPKGRTSGVRGLRYVPPVRLGSIEQMKINRGRKMILRLVTLSIVAATLLVASAEAAPSPPKANTPEGIVFKVYRDFAWEAVMAGGWDGLMEQPPAILKQYFDDKLTALILRDRKCSEKGEICRLDFVPIWASQDPAAVDLTVEKTKKTNIIKVQFRYPSTNEKMELRYQVTSTTKGWRISDISGKDWSLLKILSSPE